MGRGTSVAGGDGWATGTDCGTFASGGPMEADRPNGIPHWSQCRPPVGMRAWQFGHVVITKLCDAAPRLASERNGAPHPWQTRNEGRLRKPQVEQTISLDWVESQWLALACFQ